MKLTVKTKIRLATLASRAILAARRCTGRGPAGEFTRGGLRWRLDLREGIDFSIWLLGAYEPDLARFFDARVRPGDAVLDIGANIGAHTLRLARLVGDEGVVHAIEPTRFGVEGLRANLRLNPGLERRAGVHQLFLAERDEDSAPSTICASWPLGAAEETLSDYCGRPESTEGARTMTLDSFVQQAGLARIDLIKLDVDGHETAVLWGGEETVRRFRPDFIVELAPFVPQASGRTFEDLIGFFASLGYAFTEPGTGRALPVEPARLRERLPDGASMNVLATAGARPQ